MMAITTTALTHTYADGRTALAGLTLAIQPGESVALVGPNGAGKTTLFLRLAGVLPGTPGQARVGELDPAVPQDRKQLPRHVGIVFQNPDDQLFHATLFDDVAFGPLNLNIPRDRIPKCVAEALAAVGLAGFEGRSPHKLSGGQKRRAAIATVLAMQPEVLLFDEPTMDLDPRGRRELIGVLNALPGTKLLATHDLDFAIDVCPRVLLLDAGTLVADGQTREVLAQENLMGQHGFEVPYRLR